MHYGELFYPVLSLLKLDYADYLEILFFSTVIYYISLWLKKDTQKNLMEIFLAYYGVILFSWLASLPTILFFLLFTSPIAFILFLLFHQDSIQKNFVTLHTIKPIQKNNQDTWLEILFRTLLQASALNKKVTVIIERRQSLAAYLESATFLNLDISSDALLMLINSSLFDDSKLCWLNDSGILVSINASYKNEMIQYTTLPDHLSRENQLAMLYCAKTDAVIIQLHAITKTCSIWANSAVIHDLTLAHGLQITKKYIRRTSDKDENYDSWTSTKVNQIQSQS